MRVRKGLETLQTVKSLETLDLQDSVIDRACLPAIARVFARFKCEAPVSAGKLFVQV